MRSFLAVVGLLFLVSLFVACDAVGAGGVESDAFTLTVSESGPGLVEIEPDKSSYDQGELVTLTVVPDSGCRFDGWSGSYGSSNPLEISISADTALTAYFCVDPDGDSDGDGVANELEDTNRDGSYEDDTDGDGVADYLDIDDDGDGVLTVEELDGDSDDDNDGLPDYLESSSRDIDGDTTYDQYDNDDDGDGIYNWKEDPNGNGWYFDDDTDGDGMINAYDNDDDNDEIPSSAEEFDSDGDGVWDYLEPNNVDTDQGGFADYLDTDDDNDETLTRDEDLDGDGFWFDDDPNGNGIPAFLDPDE